MKITRRGTTLYFPDPLAISMVYFELFWLKTFDIGPLNKNPVILECGTYIGLSLLYFKQLYPDAVITAFEPEKRTFRYLQKNVSSNHLKNVTLVNAALADRIGTLSLHNSGWGIGNHLSDSTDEQSISVETQLLSDYIMGPIDLIKLDIEGAENMVLREIQPKLHLVKNLIIEYHYGISSLGTNLEEIIEILEEAGFACRQGRLGKFFHNLRKKTHHPFPYTNIIYAQKVQ